MTPNNHCFHRSIMFCVSCFVNTDPPCSYFYLGVFVMSITIIIITITIVPHLPFLYALYQHF